MLDSMHQPNSNPNATSGNIPGDAERAGMEAAKNWVDLFKRGGPFPLAIVPARPVLWHQAWKKPHVAFLVAQLA
jgi:hypothetical protein